LGSLLDELSLGFNVDGCLIAGLKIGL